MGFIDIAGVWLARAHAVYGVIFLLAPMLLFNQPPLLAALYQIGFARSKPHGAPRNNPFGSRVRDVYQQPWLAQMFSSTPGGAR